MSGESCGKVHNSKNVSLIIHRKKEEERKWDVSTLLIRGREKRTTMSTQIKRRIPGKCIYEFVPWKKRAKKRRDFLSRRTSKGGVE